jgi:drug/metabolite transporter (DMT)-like permease
MPGTASAFYRVFFACVTLSLFLLVGRQKLPSARKSPYFLAALGGAFFAGDIALFNNAVLKTSASSATFLANNAPIFVALITWALTRKLPSRRFWLAFAIALAGASLIVAVDKHHSASMSQADAMALAACLCFAGYLALTERLRETFSTAILLALSTGSSAIVLFLYARLAHVSLSIPGVLPFLALAGLGCVCQVIGYFCLTYALGHLPATVMSITMLAVAPLTAILAFALFGERITGLQIIGNCLVLIGVYIISKREPETVAV